MVTTTGALYHVSQPTWGLLDRRAELFGLPSLPSGGFAFNAVPEAEKLPATTPPPGGPGPPGRPALSDRQRDYCAAPPRANISPSGS
jgi:hypothetical protein